MNKDDLKRKVIESIDSNRERIIEIGETIYANPELGYREHFATKFVKEEFEKMGIEVESPLAITGVRAQINKHKKGPKVVVMGELDSVVCHDHPDANPENGAIHACGHHVQTAAMMGVFIGLNEANVLDELDGKIDFIAVPAEEYIEIEYRSELRETGKIKYLGGKQELARLGYLDDVDLAMMIHSTDIEPGKNVIVGPIGNGFIGKKVQFIGKESHAGGAPEKGINALNAAMLAINNINAQRETFLDSDHIRVHPIITKGGDIVNVVPADVRMETYVRARTIKGMMEANEKVNRSLIAGAYAVGGKVKITEIPGYLPLLREDNLTALFKENAQMFIREDEIIDGFEFAGSTDFGDLTHVMPAIHPLIGGVEGFLHTREFAMEDPETAYILSAKIMAMTVIDLLFDGAKKANQIIDDFEPLMTMKEYLAYLEENSKVIEK